MLLYILRKYFKSKLRRHRNAQLNQQNIEDHRKPSNETTMANLSADILSNKEEKTEELENTQPRKSVNTSSSGLLNAQHQVRCERSKRKKWKLELLLRLVSRVVLQIF